MNPQNWCNRYGMATNTAVTSASLKGVRKGEATWVAIMLVPAGITAISGLAMNT